MAFEGLAGKLQAALKRLTGKGKLNEKDVKEAMRKSDWRFLKPMLTTWWLRIL